MELRERIEKSLTERDCENCPHKIINSHTHHIGCSYFGESLITRLKMLHNPPVLNVTPKNQEEFTIDLVTLNPHGVEKGWAAWPFQFDPIWIKCRLPEKNKL